MSYKMSEKETPQGAKFRKELEKLKQMEVRVGYQEGITYPDGTSVVDVAMWNELGTSIAPSRPFMRNSVDNHIDEITQFAQSQVNTIADGNTAEQILKKIGLFQKDMVQQEITNGSFEPNAPSTIKKKGSSKPLIDTGLLRQSVNYQIKSKGGK